MITGVILYQELGKESYRERALTLQELKPLTQAANFKNANFKNTPGRLVV
jgi:hypothetical protein